jgi:hypothetical protein
MAEPQNYDDADDPYRAIRVGDAGGAGEATKWGHLLTRFMRVMAAFWLVQGLAQWQVVLASPKPIFDTMPHAAALAVIFFGVLDLVAGVGLWLATPWGGVLWLLIASAQIFVAASMPNFFSGGYWLIGVDLVLIVIYFVLTFEAGRDFEAQKVMDQRQRRKSALLRQTGRPAEAKPRAGIARFLDALSRSKKPTEAPKDAARPEPLSEAPPPPATAERAGDPRRTAQSRPARDTPATTPTKATAAPLPAYDPAQDRLARILQSTARKPPQTPQGAPAAAAKDGGTSSTAGLVNPAMRAPRDPADTSIRRPPTTPGRRPQG